MKLDRNINPDGIGKYALLKLRNLHHLEDSGTLTPDITLALDVLEKAGLLHWGNEGPGEQFFVMKYKDRFTQYALRSYANHVEAFAMRMLSNAERIELYEYAKEVRNESTLAENYGRSVPSFLAQIKPEKK